MLAAALRGTAKHTCGALRGALKRAPLQCLLSALLSAVVWSVVPSAGATMCPMCRDATAGSAPMVQRSLRRAIPVLGVPAGGIFLGILVVALRTKPKSGD
jgi:hypothetical protein